MTNNTSSVRFTFNFVAKTIVGTQASFDKASKGFGPVYEELAEKMAKHPDYSIEVKAPAKPKQTYKGMDIDFMRDFLTAMDDDATLETLNEVIAYAEKMGRSKYPLAKRVFFDTYSEFDYVNAKEVVDTYRHNRTLDAATDMAKQIELSAAA